MEITYIDKRFEVLAAVKITMLVLWGHVHNALRKLDDIEPKILFVNKNKIYEVIS